MYSWQNEILHKCASLVYELLDMSLTFLIQAKSPYVVSYED